MPSSSRHISPVPTREIRPSKDASPPRAVRFNSDTPVTGVSRPMASSEAWAMYNFEGHAQRCSSCYRPYEVHKNKGSLCEIGHALAKSVAAQLYKDKKGVVFSRTKEDDQEVHVEVNEGFEHGLGLLKAIERSERHLRRDPFVNVNHSHEFVPREPRKRTIQYRIKTVSPQRSSKYESFPEFEEPREHRHHHKHHRSSTKPQVVDWSDDESYSPNRSRSGSDSSNYSNSSASSRDYHYSVQVIEPERSTRPYDRREHRRSRYW
ncbi:MAG: hypothetical protein M1820_001415 [Bogoriella megaspora]|nr:MAG: hypothetical protein M1820_001415 [Bogoriella megaspora]